MGTRGVLEALLGDVRIHVIALGGRRGTDTITTSDKRGGSGELAKSARRHMQPMLVQRAVAQHIGAYPLSACTGPLVTVLLWVSAAGGAR